VGPRVDLRGCCIELGRDSLDLIDDAQVRFKVALGEARVPR